MTGHITVTAKCGPARQATAVVFSGITDLDFDLPREMLHFKYDGRHQEFDLHGVTTITDTITAADHAIVVS